MNLLQVQSMEFYMFMMSSSYNSWFVWNNIPVLRPPLTELPGSDSSMFASVAKHMDLQLRLVAAKGLPPRTLPYEHLVDQEDLRNRFNLSQPDSRRLSRVLEFVENHGVRLSNAKTLHVKFDIQQKAFAVEEDGLEKGEDHFEFVIDELSKRLKWGTLLGTMVICGDYPEMAEKVYLGSSAPVYVERGGQTPLLETRVVVILGIVHVGKELANSWDCPEGKYFEYQDSKGPDHRGLLGFGRTLGHPRVLQKIYQAPLWRFHEAVKDY